MSGFLGSRKSIEYIDEIVITFRVIIFTKSTPN